MRNFFAFNTGQADGCMLPDGSAYITRRASSSVQRELAQGQERAARIERASRLPLWLCVVEFVAGLVFICCLGGVLDALADTPLSEMYANAPAVFYVGGGAGVVALALLVAGFFRKKRVTESAAMPYIAAEAERTVARAKEDLHIPADAARTDILICYYKITKNGRVRYKKFPCLYTNHEFFVYVRGDSLCLSTLEFVAEVPLTSIRSLRRVEKRAEVFGWNKEQSFRSQQFKPYKLRASQFGTFFLRQYFSLTVSGSHGDFEILFPPYEEQAIRTIAGLPAA